MGGMDSGRDPYRENLSESDLRDLQAQIERNMGGGGRGDYRELPAAAGDRPPIGEYPRARADWSRGPDPNVVAGQTESGVPNSDFPPGRAQGSSHGPAPSEIAAFNHAPGFTQNGVTPARTLPGVEGIAPNEIMPNPGSGGGSWTGAPTPTGSSSDLGRALPAGDWAHGKLAEINSRQPFGQDAAYYQGDVIVGKDGTRYVPDANGGFSQHYHNERAILDAAQRGDPAMLAKAEVLARNDPAVRALLDDLRAKDIGNSPERKKWDLDHSLELSDRMAAYPSNSLERADLASQRVAPSGEARTLERRDPDAGSFVKELVNIGMRDVTETGRGIGWVDTEDKGHHVNFSDIPDALSTLRERIAANGGAPATNNSSANGGKPPKK